MKIKCKSCEEVYQIVQGACPSCGNRGGFIQEPKIAQMGKLKIHLEDVLVHSSSGNEYQIKEIQKNGLIVKVIKCPIPLPDKPVYLSSENINEYKLK